MYESNTSILLKWHEEGFQYPVPFPGNLGEWKEADRVYFLRRCFNEAIAKFTSVPLWEDGEIPDYHPEFKLQNKPQLVFFPSTMGNPRGLIIVCGGGGFNIKAIHESFAVAARYIKAGFASAVLDYRLKPYSAYTTVLDLLRAVKVARRNAGSWNIDTNHIAVTGFSAGGFLSSMAAVHYDHGNPDSDDPVERVSSRPDAVLICYGVFSQCSFPKTGKFMLFETKSDNDETEIFPEPTKDSGLVSTFNDIDRKHKVYFSVEKNIREDSPPFFIWQTNVDDDPRHALKLAVELTDRGVPFELHCFPDGHHGMGLCDGTTPPFSGNSHAAHWVELAVEWFEGLGF
jgi:acetyl esterase/lipase